MLLEVTTQTWLITGLGFGIVLLLLLVFVYIMKLLGWIMQPHKKAKAEQKVDDSTNAAIATSIAMADDEAELAAVTYALNLYYGVHDIEPAHLTIHQHHTMWNNELN